jgi:hypoxanthine phosphoribosyltransferase
LNVVDKEATPVKYQPFEILLDADRIKKRVAELGRQVNKDYQGQSVVLLGVLKGCVVFLADLMRELSVSVEVEFVSASSYREGAKRDGNLVIGGASAIDLKGRHVLVVEGIVDSGRTISVLLKHLQALEPASIEVVTLVDKPASHRVDLKLKYVGFRVGNEFVIGYGLDNTQRYRHLPYIGRMVER